MVSKTSAMPSSIPARLAGRDWEIIPTSRKVVALTFDAGSDAAGTASILATLRNDGVPATFFLTGEFAAGFPSTARAIAVAGHRIGDHSMSHPYFTHLTDAQIATQLSSAAARITAVTGRDPRPLFRFPYGDSDARTIRTVNRNGYAAVRWTVDSLGWKGTSGGVTTDTVVTRVLGAARPGEIVLMHVGANPDDHSTLDAAALPRVISGLRADGYTFITLDALTG